MPYKEQNVYIPYPVADVFAAGSLVDTIPAHIDELHVTFAPDASEIIEGVAVMAQVKVGGTDLRLRGSVEKHNAETWQVSIGLASKLARASLQLWLEEDEERAGTEVFYGLGIEVVGGGLLGRLAKPALQPQMNRIMPKFARLYSGNVIQELENSRQQHHKNAA